MHPILFTLHQKKIYVYHNIGCRLEKYYCRRMGYSASYLWVSPCSGLSKRTHEKPLFPEKIFFPLLEAHDGNLPRIGTEVIGHQTLIFGGHAMTELTPVNKAKYVKSLQPFLPQHADFQSIAGEIIPNQDDWLIFANT